MKKSLMHIFIITKKYKYAIFSQKKEPDISPILFQAIKGGA